VRVSRTSFLDGELGSSVMGLTLTSKPDLTVTYNKTTEHFLLCRNAVSTVQVITQMLISSYYNRFLVSL